ncbi:hypothetical protein DH09_20850 [Bacillaceae bacterium JMAK1]|nr:hypothetical protein DH09_20850 [Bacillaceae bacterium JMAK1]
MGCHSGNKKHEPKIPCLDQHQHQCGCGCSCVCKEVEWILKHQLDGCAQSCYCLSLKNEGNYGTIPVLFKTSHNHLLYAFGKDRFGESFVTVYFRVKEIDDEGCVTLELLRPSTPIVIQENATQIPIQSVNVDQVQLQRTWQYAVVDCHALCQVQCLDPNLVRR